VKPDSMSPAFVLDSCGFLEYGLGGLYAKGRDGSPSRPQRLRLALREASCTDVVVKGNTVRPKDL
jgi:hypothetical protein